MFTSKNCVHVIISHVVSPVYCFSIVFVVAAAAAGDDDDETRPLHDVNVFFQRFDIDSSAVKF